MDFRIPVALLLAIAILLAPIVVADNEDFAFDVADDLQVEFEGGRLLKWSERELTAYVGRAFHLIVPREAFEGNVKYFEAKKHSGKSIPSWLLFDKKEGVFWGVPLVQDVGEVQLTVKATGDKKSSEEIKINVVEPSEEAPGVGKCQANEDNTILTLLLDKSIRSIKPKQRVIAINNIAKFFGLPYSAFTLKPQIEKDDITDSSVVLAGPGNLQSKTSKVISLLQVAVGCDGRLWLSTASMVHQLKQQARDGTIAEVLRLPLIGWRIKTETKPIVRSKRQITGEIDDYGSGDYNDDDDYYDDYEEYDVDGLEDIEKSPPSTKTPVTSTTLQTTSGTTETTTHPHRHHHGDKNKSNPNMHYQTTNNNHTYEERIPVTSSSTIHRTEPTTTTTTTSTSTTTPQPPSIGVTKAIKPDDVLSYGDDNYDYGEYDDEDDIDDAVESETIVPDQTGRSKQTFVPPFEDTESMTTEETTIKTTAKEISPETQPTIWNSTTSTSTTTTPTTTTATTTTTTTTTTTPPSTISISTTTTATPTEAPTTFQIVVENDPQIDYTSETEKPATTTSEATTPIETTEATTTTTTTTMPPPPPPPPTTTTTTSTTTSTTTTTTELPTTQTETTSTTEILTTQKSTASIRDFTEIENQRNFNPFIENRLQQMSVIAGKVFRFVIPHNTFKDFEDEYNLTYQLLDSNNRTVTNNSWLYFNPSRREIYGLPLEEDVSKWVFWVKAFDREGGSEQEKLNIQVQQHKLDLVVNHEFSVYIRIEKHQEFSHYVDWSLRVLRALGKIFNTNMSEITVRRINYTNEPVTFTWSNDSIPTNYCAKTEIEELFKTLTANDRGDPSRELNHALAPELRVKKVTFRELGVCEQPMTPVTPPMNFSPILRNPVDHVNATVGELLVYKVKDDTFYDPEDVDPRMLNISLLTGDRQPIPPDNWLQFDNKNREFFGIPRKVGRSEYQLICVDSGGLPATDSLEVFVYPAAKTPYNVEFSMTINELPHETFINSASLQKKFVEKLVDLFGESSASNIHLLPFKKTDDSTIVTWFNKSLATNRCPQEKIKYLESVLHNMNDKSISHKVHSIMEPEFQVSTIKVNLIGNCRPRVTQEMKPEGGVSTEETTPQSSSDEYLITFIVPAIIISIMLFLAIIAAIVLYRRKRMGKMNVEEDGRQSYGNKGIPVIFQEELEEKPEPGTKAPVILKDEKPPLAPPEYSKSGSVKLSDDSEPYQPPPPFTRTQDNGRQARPKPTPTYRKPPPYVPP